MLASGMKVEVECVVEMCTLMNHLYILDIMLAITV